MAVVFKNNAKTTLASSLSSSATSVSVADGSVFPSLGSGEIFFCTLDDGTNNEIVKVTAVSSNTLTVVRAQESTTARSFASGDAAELRLTAGILSLFSQTGVAITDEIEAYLDANGLTFPDNIRAKFGGGNDFAIYHSGFDTYLDNATGHLVLRNLANDKDIVLQSDNGSGGTADYLRIDGSNTNIAVSKTMVFADSTKASFGAAEDLRVSHDGTNSFLANHTGNLYLQQNLDDGDIIFQSDDGSGGVATYFQLDGSEVVTSFLKTTRHLDSVKAMFGSSNDLQIYHDGSNSYIDNNTADLRIRGAYVKLQGLNGENMLVGNQNGAVELYHDNNKKFETTSSGIDVTGLVTIDTNPGSTYGVSEALRIDDTGGTTDRALQIFELLHSGARSHRLTFNTNITTDGSSAYTYTQGNYGGSSQIEFGNNGLIVFYTDAQNTGGSTTAITPTERLRIKETGEVQVQGELIANGNIRVNNNSNYVATRQILARDTNGLSFKTSGGGTTMFYTNAGDVTVSNNLNVSGNVDVDGTLETDALTINGTASVPFESADHSKLDGIEAGATADQTQSEINALGITATGLSGSPNITVGTISSSTITSSGSITSSGTLTGASSELLRRTVSGWTVPTQTVLGSYYGTNLGDYIYLKAPGNSTNNHGIALVTDNAFYYGRTSIETGQVTNSSSAPLDESTGLKVTHDGNATFAGSIQGSSFSDGTISGITFIDEDSFSTNSATRVPTQQSVKAYVDAQVAGVVDSAPSALNTLNELAAALGDDSNFATTTSTSLGNRLRVDTASQGLTATQQGNAITNLGITATKAELNFVDGVTSNIQTQLNARLTSSSSLNASNISSGTLSNSRLPTQLKNNHLLSGSNAILRFGETDVTNTPVWWLVADGGNFSIRLNNSGGYPFNITTNSDNNAVSSIGLGYATTIQGNTAWHAGNDGSGSGLDADTVDGINSGSFLRSDATDTASGNLTFTGNINQTGGTFISHGSEVSSLTTAWQAAGTSKNRGILPFRYQNGATGQPESGNNANWGLNIYAHGGSSGNYPYGTQFAMGSSQNLYFRWFSNGGAQSWQEVWTSVNDGSGSGLDSDTVDGIQASSFLRSDAADSASGTLDLNGRVNMGFSVTRPAALNSDSVAQARIGGNDVFLYVASLGASGGYDVAVQAARASDFASFDLNLQSNGGNLQRAGNKVWDAGNDGSGSGLDADTVDGIQGGSFLRSDATDTFGSQLSSANNVPIRFVAANATDTNDGKIGAGVFASGLNIVGAQTSSGTGRQVRIWGDVITDAGNKFWNAGNDGSGSGLDADTLDGINSGSFLRSDATDSASGLITLGNGVIITKASSDQNTSQDSASIPSTSGAEIVKFQGGYTNGQYTTEFAKVDRSGNLPLYVRQSKGTANSFSNIARFGDHGQTNGSDVFAVFGGARVSGRVTADNLTLNSLSAQNSEATALMINGSNVVGTRELGSNAFNSTTIPTNNNQLTNGAGYITGLAFNSLSSKTSGTGTYSTSGILQAGRGSGGVGLTVNDGQGNANVTFNHISGTPEQAGNCGRIVVNTDATSGAKMTFELVSNSGTSNINTPSRLELTEDGAFFQEYLYHLGDTNTYIRFTDDAITLRSGGVDLLNLVEAATDYVDVGAELRMNNTKVIDTSRNLTAVGITGTGSYHEIGNNTGAVSNDGSWNARLNIAGTSHARLDLFEDADDARLRLYVHSGQHARIDTVSNDEIHFGTNSSVRFKATSAGLDINSGHSLTHNGTTVLDSSRNITATTVASSGKLAVMSSSVHGSYDFYNNGTSYLNGAAIIDDALDLTGSNRALKLAGTTILNSSNYMGNVARFYFQNNMTGTYIEAESSYLEINNSNGYTRIGAGNSSYSHFYTDRGRYYFNKRIQVDEGIVQSHNEDLQLRRTNSSNDRVVIGDTVIQFFLDGSEDMRLTNNGNLDVEGDVTAFSTVVASDERLKDDVLTIKNAVDKVSQLRGVEFVWNKGKREGKQDIGVIAQEVEKVLPEVVIEKELPLMEEGTTYKTVDYPKLTAVLIEAIKEQQEEIKELKDHSHKPKNLDEMEGFDSIIEEINSLKSEIKRLKGE